MASDSEDMCKLRRFICCGSQSGILKCDPAESSNNLNDLPFITNLLAAGQGVEAVNEIKKFSLEGRSVKQSALLLALAFLARKSMDKLEVKHAVYAAIGEICRIPSHLFQFVDYMQKVCDKTTGWGRGLRAAVGRWYNSRDPRELMVHVTKYKQRHGWSHRDLLRLCHVNPNSEGQKSVITVLLKTTCTCVVSLARTLIVKYIIKGLEKTRGDYNDDSPAELRDILTYLEAVETVKHSQNEEDVARLVETHRLVREHVPTWFLNSVMVWKALIPEMPVVAMVRSLVKMGLLGLLDPDSPDSCAETVVGKLSNQELIQNSRIHPMTLLVGMTMYKKGETDKSKKLKWTPNTAVVEAMEQAFYNSFQSVSASGKRHLLAISLSSSMQHGGVIGSSHVSPLEAAVAMVTVTVRVETDYKVLGYSSDGLVEIGVNAGTTLGDVNAEVAKVSGGGTDCVKPIAWALEKHVAVDVFVLFVDGDVSSQSSPVDALLEYRSQMERPDTRLVLCSVTSKSSALNTEDPGILEIVGFDDTVPRVIHEFAKGGI